MNKIKNKFIFKIALLSISLFIYSAATISPTLTLISKSFPNISSTSIEMLLTVSYFGIMVGLLISPILVRYLGQKIVIITGLILTALCGAFPAFSNSFALIMTSRILLGFGIGLFNSLAVSLIPQFYQDEPDEMASMVGFQTITGYIGSALSSFVIGYLVSINWHVPFLIFLIAIPIMILFTIAVPLPKAKATKKVDTTKKGKVHFNSKIIIILIVMFLMYLFYMPISFELPAFIVDNHIGSPSTTGLVTGISTLIGIPVGAIFGKVYGKLHSKVFPIGFGLVALGFLMIVFSKNLAILIASVIVVGIGYGLGEPFLYNWIDNVAERNIINLVTTIVLILSNIGSFISPQVINSLAKVTNHATSQGIFMISSILYVIIFAFALIYYFTAGRKEAQ